MSNEKVPFLVLLFSLDYKSFLGQRSCHIHFSIFRVQCSTWQREDESSIFNDKKLLEKNTLCDSLSVTFLGWAEGDRDTIDDLNERQVLESESKQLFNPT